jgi:membrane-associated phospholipid phosphatase
MPALVGWFALVTVLAIWPLQAFDKSTNAHWAHRLTPSLMPLFNHVLDRVASHDVNLPLIVIAALVATWTSRSPRPILLAALAEGGFYLTGAVKLAFARPAPGLHDDRFFRGGWWSDGRFGVSYPSGHSAEAVLIYGMMVYILATYTPITAKGLQWLRVLWLIVIINCVFTSYYLGYHWITDLVAGLVFGALLLRLLIALDRGHKPFHRLPVPDWLAWPPRPRRTVQAPSSPPSNAPATTPRSSLQA